VIASSTINPNIDAGDIAGRSDVARAAAFHVAVKGQSKMLSNLVVQSQAGGSDLYSAWAERGGHRGSGHVIRKRNRQARLQAYESVNNQMLASDPTAGISTKRPTGCLVART